MYFRFIFCFKLSLVMGINWILVVAIDALELLNEINYKNILKIVCNFGFALQGVFTFIICICDKSTLNKMFGSTIEPLIKKSKENQTQKSNLGTFSRTKNEDLKNIASNSVTEVHTSN